MPGLNRTYTLLTPRKFGTFLKIPETKWDMPTQKKKKNEICTSFIKTEFHLEFQATGLFPVEPFLIGEHETWYPEKVEGSEGWF